jgi:hypothetical protein
VARAWVRRDERAAYEWIFDALPKEREFVLRAYPLLAVPIAFLWLGARGESPRAQEGWLALLLFLPGAYLPLLAAQVPGSASYRARWLLDTAPVERGAVDNGAIKAIAVRFLVPLAAVLAALGSVLGSAETVARLLLPALLAWIVVLRVTWRTCAAEQPLSVPPDELYVNQDWLGLLAVIAGVLTAAGIAATRLIDSWWKALLLAAMMVALEVRLDRKQRAGVLQPA